MKTLDMTKGDPLKLAFAFIVPVFTGLLFQQIYNFADTMMVGAGLGDKAVAAVGSTAPLYSVLINFANGLNNGYSIIIARIFGENDKKHLRKAVATMLSLNLLISVSLTLIFLPLLPYLLRWLDTPEGIYKQEYSYIFVILSGLAATICYNMSAGFMQAVGNSKTPLIFLGIACISNIVLDWLFIFIFKFGIAGAAVATVISQILSAVLSFVFIVKTYKDLLPRWEDFKFNRILFNEMFTTGLSMGLMMSAYSLGSIILQKGINKLGLSVITAQTASRRILEMFMMPIAALSVAASTFVSQNYGARKYDRIKGFIKLLMVLSLVWGILAVVLIFLVGKSMLAMIITSGNAETMDKALLNLRFCVLFFFPLGVLCTFRACMQAMEYKIAPLLSGVIELVFKIFFAAFFIPAIGYMGAVMAEPIIWIICTVYLFAAYYITKKRI